MLVFAVSLISCPCHSAFAVVSLRRLHRSSVRLLHSIQFPSFAGESQFLFLKLFALFISCHTEGVNLWSWAHKHTHAQTPAGPWMCKDKTIRVKNIRLLMRPQDQQDIKTVRVCVCVCLCVYIQYSMYVYIGILYSHVSLSIFSCKCFF